MSLRESIRGQGARPARDRAIFQRFGILENPFPPASQTANNPHRRTAMDDDIERRILGFDRDKRTQVLVIEGTQGTGKTNVLNFWEKEIAEAYEEEDGFYVVRYLSDPEASFDGTIRKLLQALGTNHIERLGVALRADATPIERARTIEMRSALERLADDLAPEVVEALNEWLLGSRLLKRHQELLGVTFRLDTVEAKTGALRDLIAVSSEAGVLMGVFLLLDELEKQEGVLSPNAAVKYLSGLRAIIDAIPRHLFLMIAVTPDALRRFGVALPALRARLTNRIEITPLTERTEALSLARFYLDAAAQEAERSRGRAPRSARQVLHDDEILATFDAMLTSALANSDTGLRQRAFLNQLHLEAARAIEARR